MDVQPLITRITRRPPRCALAPNPNPPASVWPVFNPSATPFCTSVLRFSWLMLLYLNDFSLSYA